MNDYIHGSLLGLSIIALASHAHPVIVFGFFVMTLINLFLIVSYFVRYMTNK